MRRPSPRNALTVRGPAGLGAASWRLQDTLDGALSPFALIGRHVLLPHASSVTDQAAWLRAGLADEAIAAAVAAVPDAWWTAPPALEPGAYRAAFAARLRARRDAMAVYLQEAEGARARAL